MRARRAASREARAVGWRKLVHAPVELLRRSSPPRAAAGCAAVRGSRKRRPRLARRPARVALRRPGAFAAAAVPSLSGRLSRAGLAWRWPVQLAVPARAIRTATPRRASEPSTAPARRRGAAPAAARRRPRGADQAAAPDIAGARGRHARAHRRPRPRARARRPRRPRRAPAASRSRAATGRSSARALAAGSRRCVRGWPAERRAARRAAAAAARRLPWRPSGTATGSPARRRPAAVRRRALPNALLPAISGPAVPASPISSAPTANRVAHAIPSASSVDRRRSPTRARARRPRGSGPARSSAGRSRTAARRAGSARP